MLQDTLPGFCDVEEEGVPLGKVQLQDVGLLSELSVKVILPPGQILVLFVVIPAMGAGGVITGKVVVHNPRPWVAAAIVPSPLRYLSIWVLTVGKVALAVHTVDAPSSESVCHTPVSVAINALPLVPG